MIQPLITPLENMVVAPVIDEEQNDEVDPYTPDPEIYELLSDNPDVFSVGDGEVVGALDNCIIIKTNFETVVTPPAYYKVPKLTFNEVTQEYDTEWITPSPKVISRYYYLSYDNIVSDLKIGDIVTTGQVIGQTIENKLIYSATNMSGFDINPFTII